MDDNKIFGCHVPLDLKYGESSREEILEIFINFCGHLYVHFQWEFWFNQSNIVHFILSIGLGKSFPF